MFEPRFDDAWLSPRRALSHGDYDGPAQWLAFACAHECGAPCARPSAAAGPWLDEPDRVGVEWASRLAELAAAASAARALILRALSLLNRVSSSGNGAS